MTENEAIELAKAVACTEGWVWVEPASTIFRCPWFKRKGGLWEVFSHAHGLGAMVRVVIDDETGVVLEKGYIGR